MIAQHCISHATLNLFPAIYTSLRPILNLNSDKSGTQTQTQTLHRDELDFAVQISCDTRIE